MFHKFRVCNVPSFIYIYFSHYITSTNKCFTTTILFLKMFCWPNTVQRGFQLAAWVFCPSTPVILTTSFMLLLVTMPGIVFFHNRNNFQTQTALTALQVKKCLLLQPSLASILSYSTNNNTIDPCPIHIHTKNTSEWGPCTVFMVHRTFWTWPQRMWYFHFLT